MYIIIYLNKNYIIFSVQIDSFNVIYIHSLEKYIYQKCVTFMNKFLRFRNKKFDRR